MTNALLPSYTASPVTALIFFLTRATVVTVMMCIHIREQ